jgi:uncharacterized membrane protein YgcG
MPNKTVKYAFTFVKIILKRLSTPAMQAPILQWKANKRLAQIIKYLHIAVWVIFLSYLIWGWFYFSSKEVKLLFVPSAIGLILGLAFINSLRRKFIRESILPLHVQVKLQKIYPHLSNSNTDLVMQGLRQFFLAYSQSQKKFVAMPSQVADEAWHEFILDTKNYSDWCKIAFGKYLHHSPAVVLGKDKAKNDGLRRVWYWACKADGINPNSPLRLPLLFALDKKLKIENGFFYETNCKLAGQREDYCGSDFGGSSGGSDSSGDFEFSDASSDGGGCGGGCGGGD